MKSNTIVLVLALTLSGMFSCTEDSVIDNNELPPNSNEPEIGLLNDIDGNSYRTVKIGNQYWMKENFKSSKYNDGTPIKNIQSGAAWAKSLEGAYCSYQNESHYSDTFGLLYNYYAIESGKLCPEGWRIPTADDWKTLLTYIDSVLQVPNECDALRSYSGWINEHQDIDANGLDLLGFKALPTGYLALVSDDSVDFYGKQSWTMFWSNTNSGNKDSTHIYVLDLSPYNPSKIDESGYSISALPKNYGLSIRLIKE
jgi:uncharacterized protein (TIGR02145 family)